MGVAEHVFDKPIDVLHADEKALRLAQRGTRGRAVGALEPGGPDTMPKNIKLAESLPLDVAPYCSHVLARSAGKAELRHLRRYCSTLSVRAARKAEQRTFRAQQQLIEGLQLLLDRIDRCLRGESGG